MQSTRKPVLDPCCGARKFYFKKDSPIVLFGDIRDESFVQCDRTLRVHPDMQLDVTSLPFPDESFALVVFDPPHLKRAGENSFLKQSYGLLPHEDPLDFLPKAFDECWRVLKPEGTLIFKWNETHIPLKSVLKRLRQTPLFGNRRPSKSTFWMVFFKEKSDKKD